MSAKVSAQISSGAIGPVPVEVIDGKSVVRARGITGSSITLPPGRYLVMARTPDGREWTSEQFLELAEGADATVELQTEAAADTGAALDDSGSVLESVSSRDPPQATAGPALQMSLWRGQWLRHWMEGDGEASVPGADPPLKRDRQWRLAASDSLPLTATPGADALIEVPGDQGSDYFTVPFDHVFEPNRETMVTNTTVEAIKPAIRFNFRSADIDNLLEFVTQGHSDSARVISQSIVHQAENLLMNKQQSPLLAVVGGYVLLRANELDGLDAWTQHLLGLVNDILPDARILRVETLARLGNHSEAVNVLGSGASLRMPWFRSGVGYLSQRLELYLKYSETPSKSLSLSQVQRETFAKVLRAIKRVSWALDKSSSFCVYRKLKDV